MPEDIEKIARVLVRTFQGEASAYYDDAERYMEKQWETLIWPLVKDFDFRVTLDFAAGHGRNSTHLAKLAKQLYMVDANLDAVKFLEKRFAGYDRRQCSIEILQNSGVDLRDIPSERISALYSFDSMVHFEKRLIEAYMPEFCRVLAPGAYGFLHHSDFGRVSQDPDFRHHPGSRSNVDKDWFAQCCFRHKLLTVKQTLIPWWVGDVGIEDFDCISLIYKPRRWPPA